MANLLRFSACLFVLLSFNAKALVINGCTIEPYTSCPNITIPPTNLYQKNISYSDFSGAVIHGSNLGEANLSYSNFNGASLSGDWNMVNLFSADLSNSFIDGIYANGADLRNANLSNSRVVMSLWDADLSNANLKNSNFQNSTFIATNLSGADLSGADFSGASMQGNMLFDEAIYSESTIFPWYVSAYGAIFVSEVPLPAGIYLFLSGLVGLGFVKGKKKVSLNLL